MAIASVWEFHLGDTLAIWLFWLAVLSLFSSGGLFRLRSLDRLYTFWFAFGLPFFLFLLFLFLYIMFATRRPNTIELSLPTSIRRNREIVTRDDVIKSIKNVLGNDSRTSIQCIQRATNGMSYRVTFKPESLRPRESLLTQGIYLKGTFCYFMGAEATYQVITVSNLPFEVSDAGVQAFFETFGEVREIIRNKDKYGFETGDRRLLMVLGHHIPASVFLDPFTAHVKYRDQPLCCYHCNWWGIPIEIVL